MKTTKQYKSFAMVIVALVTMTATFSCKKFADLDAPLNKVSASTAYITDASATASTVSLYNYGIFGSLPSLLQTINFYGGLSADELHYTVTTNPPNTEIENDQISPANTSVANLWSYSYSQLLVANDAITGITASTTLTPSVKSQLLGEAKFFRAFTNFYLVNYFGDVPLTTSDPTASAYFPRSPKANVYQSIVSDLKDAQSLLPTAYVGTLRSRVNQYAAMALLARVYLYQKDYANAEAMATSVINSGTYSLAPTANVFINTSNETILQFATYYGFSTFAQAYRTSTSAANIAPPSYTLTSYVANSFEANDNRKTNWVDSTTNGSKFYRINKYKIYTAATANAGNEYNVVLRLAEQYLIRAEARAQQGNLVGAISDINTIRTRAGLAGTTAVTQTALLAAIAQERKVELFGEFSHRWFDLIRTGQATSVLTPLKPLYSASRSMLFPVPDAQIKLNPSLTQNPGY